ncbi:MAG: cyclic peptide export ABC transporter [Bacteroidota bacterium]
MELFYLLKREIKQPIRPLLIFIAISGIANAVLIAIINRAAENVANAQVSNKYFLLYVCGVMVILFSKKYVLDKSCAIIESVMCRLRNRIANKIRHTELNILELIGTAPIYARLTQDASYITNVSTTMISAIQSAIMIGFTLVYVGTISVWSFLMVIATMGLGVAYYFRHSKSFLTMWQTVSIKLTGFIENLGHILQGFKEIKINRNKNEGVYKSYKTINKELRDNRIKTSLSYNIMLIFTQILFFLLLGVVLFGIPHFHAEHAEDVIKVTAAILFIIGPFEGLVSSMSMIDQAKDAIQNIINLEQQLEEEMKKHKLSVKAQSHRQTFETLPYFESIQFKGLQYSYPPTPEREHIFTVGPVDLTLRKGELIFITGGNGSGKSTFLKLLTGLYPPKGGHIVVDAGLEGSEGTVVTAKNYQQYRNLFTTIFTDFHLFDKLYGVEKADAGLVNRVLQNMGLPPEKVTYGKGKFSNLHLSTGQKKRLALTTCIIEDKPIYIFDEVAADLDPGFRDKYYYELLRELKERNKTVIVVSHDRHYWTVPDRLLEMVNGSIRELPREEIDSMLAFERQATW